MKVTVTSISERCGNAVAKAIAEAPHAKIHLEVRFECKSEPNIGQRARDEILRYLDIA